MFKNKQRVCEPWLLHEFDQDFYGEEIRLLVCAYLRPEADFVSVQVGCIRRGAGGSLEQWAGNAQVHAPAALLFARRSLR